MDIRPYQPSDRDACLAIDNRPEFEAFLADPAGPFFVLDHEGAVVGCGGYEISPGADVATLLWGAIRPDLRRNGLGRFLLLYRLREIGKAGVPVVRAEAPSGSVPFFEKQGFRTIRHFEGGVETIKKLTVCP